MPPWISHIVSAQRKESKYYSSRWVQLATIASNNTPRVRTVVFRGWSDSYDMEIFTDKRSQKYQELLLNNNVEVCWYFNKSKCQFRFRGKTILVSDTNKLSHWNELNDNSKSIWGGERPGELYNFNKKDELITGNKIDFSDNFILLKINITHVDKLQILKPEHIRTRWVRESEWIEERINP
tara:strand:- start:1475 stop:2017 length:543 start_codon:yes stop_codon:yes gene_type:complete